MRLLSIVSLILAIIAISIWNFSNVPLKHTTVTDAGQPATTPLTTIEVSQSKPQRTGFTYRLVRRSGDVLDGHTLVRLGPATLNDQGEVAFSSLYEETDSTVIGKGIFRETAPVLAPSPADRQNSLSVGPPRMNSTGVVAFAGSLGDHSNSGGVFEHTVGMFVDGALTEIRGISPYISNSGRLIYQGDGNAIYSALPGATSESSLRIIPEKIDGRNAEVRQGYSSNNSGDVIAHIVLTDIGAPFVFGDGLWSKGEFRKSTAESHFSPLPVPSISDNGQIAFALRALDGGVSLHRNGIMIDRSIGPELTAIQTTECPWACLQINNRGTVLFGSTIYYENQAPISVIPVFGRTAFWTELVGDIGALETTDCALNNLDQIVCTMAFENGSVIVLASPVEQACDVRYRDLLLQAEDIEKFADRIENDDNEYQKAVLDILLFGYDADVARLGLSAVHENEVRGLFSDQTMVAAQRALIVARMKRNATNLSRIAELGLGLERDYGPFSKDVVEYFCHRDYSRIADPQSVWNALQMAGFVDQELFESTNVLLALQRGVEVVVSASLMADVITLGSTAVAAPRYLLRIGEIPSFIRQAQRSLLSTLSQRRLPRQGASITSATQALAISSSSNAERVVEILRSGGVSKTIQLIDPATVSATELVSVGIGLEREIVAARQLGMYVAKQSNGVDDLLVRGGGAALRVDLISESRLALVGGPSKGLPENLGGFGSRMQALRTVADALKLEPIFAYAKGTQGRVIEVARRYVNVIEIAE